MLTRSSENYQQLQQWPSTSPKGRVLRGQRKNHLKLHSVNGTVRAVILRMIHSRLEIMDKIYKVFETFWKNMSITLSGTHFGY